MQASIPIVADPVHFHLLPYTACTSVTPPPPHLLTDDDHEVNGVLSQAKPQGSLQA